jgi:quercetin dioxygenase-like cupin family protein
LAAITFKRKKSIVKKILLGICLIFLLSGHLWAQDENAVKVSVLAKKGSSWDGNALPAYQKGEPEITILKITIPPKMPLPLHQHPVINAGVLLKGELTVVTEEKETLHLKAGDAIIEVVDKWHYGINEGTMPAEIIVFYAGTKDLPVTIKETDKDKSR